MLVVIFLFSPLAGFLADIKFSAFKVLICSTYIMLVATICLCSFGVNSLHSSQHWQLLLLTGSFIFVGNASV